ncbi:molybdopterin converting factor subunit 1 [Roseospira marina]|uniref:Molybdopterin converting factor subunit 1 n=1 Tax=Roseospira marina TaxID=140057 RepID=A0A5M6IHV0_9PROT|nr:molybdopterin converting factor subunit 1 [Roseospira marina]KAA5607215.1 molybdopterin converting factor subunit 1 [Roseospira marina]MBB4312635.1 molybdopterin synthase sulfur carrier subunit [Roseospira marina]MBB5085349.1 molybdopterin synthase sulfur carrier subunit [Roseospira marina]
MKVLYFAWLRDFIGTGEETLDALPPQITTVCDLMGWLSGRGPAYARAFADPALVRCAVDQDFAGLDVEVTGAREVAFFPPVTGG